ncbi:MAG: MFS transporter [Candidatus Bathyarchaeota archaeon]|nr:MFS transporter [Candidatus Bathyarchaeota archaeon]
MEEHKQQTYKEILSYGLIVMAVTHTLAHAFQNMHTALYPKLVEEFALTNQQIGLISSIPSLVSAILSIPMGLLSDRLGAKKMILLSITVATSGAVLAGLAQNPYMLILAISLLYLNTTIYHPASYSFTTFLFAPRDRPKALGVLGAGGTLGMALGPISVSILVGILGLGWRRAYISWIVPLLIGIVAVWYIKFIPTAEDEDKKSEEPGNSHGAAKLWTTSLVMFLIFGGLRMAAPAMTRTFLSIWLVNTRGMEFALASLIFGASSLMGIVASPLGGVFAARYGEKRWTTYTTIASIICFALAFIVPGNIAFTVFYIGYGFFNLFSMAANSAITAKLTPSKQRGLGFALYFLPGSIMGAVAPMAAAFIADIWGMYSVFMASIVVFAFAWIVFTFGVKVD